MISFTVLVVCTGNLARSPMTQRILQTLLASRPEIAVTSAGTHARAGEPMAPDAEKALREIGISPGAFEATELTPTLVGAADLVLTATREHRGVVLADRPDALRRTFMIKEMARILTTASPPPTGSWKDLTTLVRSASDQRGRHGRVPDALDNLADPYARGLERYRMCRDEIADAARVIAAGLLAAPTVDTPTEGDSP